MNILYLIIFIVIFVIIYKNVKTEKFNTFYGKFPYAYPKTYCSSCGNLNIHECGKCVNCGYCVNNEGIGSCEAGDNNGPYFAENCSYWFPDGNDILLPQVPVLFNPYNVPTYKFHSQHENIRYPKYFDHKRKDFHHSK